MYFRGVLLNVNPRNGRMVSLEEVPSREKYLNGESQSTYLLDSNKGWQVTIKNPNII